MTPDSPAELRARGLALKAHAEALLTILHAQARRPYFVELAGTPKAGKTTALHVLERFFKSCGYRVHTMRERAADCPIAMKGHFFFNTWTTCSMIAEVLAMIDTDTDVLVLDRGFFDALMWLELQHRRGQVTPEEKKVFVDTFTKTGFTGGINWYRNFTRNWQRAEGLDHHVRVPSLMIMAENDAVLPPSAADGMEKLIPDLEKYLVKDSGHWTQQEKPEEVSAKLIEWRRKRFG